MSKLELIIEDFTCVDGANSYASIDCGRSYWSNRFGGEKWDLSYSGENHCDDDICRAMIGAMDWLKCLNFAPNTCDFSCVPTPVNCYCGGKSSYELLKEAQIIAADAILRGWNPFASNVSNGPLVRSVSSPDEGSINFAVPVPLSMSCGKVGDNYGREVKRRIYSILDPLLVKKTRGIRVMS